MRHARLTLVLAGISLAAPSAAAGSAAGRTPAVAAEPSARAARTCPAVRAGSRTAFDVRTAGIGCRAARAAARRAARMPVRYRSRGLLCVRQSVLREDDRVVSARYRCTRRRAAVEFTVR